MSHKATTEHYLMDKVSAELKHMREAGVPLWYLKVQGGPAQRPGVPDYLMCVNGIFVAAELKAPDAPLVYSPRQALEARDITAAGGKVELHSSVGGVIAFVDEVLASSGYR